MTKPVFSTVLSNYYPLIVASMFQLLCSRYFMCFSCINTTLGKRMDVVIVGLGVSSPLLENGGSRGVPLGIPF